MFSPILLNAHNPGPMTGRGNNTYLLAAAHGTALLVDAGVGKSEHLADLRNALDEQQARLDRVIVTHGHADHASGAPAIAAIYPARFAKLPWPEEDARYPVEWEPLADGEAVKIGDESLTVVHTPGHSPDHAVLWHAESRTAFTGDLVVAGSSVMIHSSRGGNLQQYLDSLQRVGSLAPRLLLPAHGPAVDNPAQLLSEYLQHRLMRERQVIGALRAGHATVQAIAESIYDGLDPALMAAARENVRAHLEKLKAERRATDAGGRWRVTKVRLEQPSEEP